MKITVNNNDYYIDVDDVKSVYVEQREWNNVTKWEVMVLYTHISLPPMQFTIKDHADELAKKIGEHITSKENGEQEYIKGFKAGVEYALKLKS